MRGTTAGLDPSGSILSSLGKAVQQDLVKAAMPFFQCSRGKVSFGAMGVAIGKAEAAKKKGSFPRMHLSKMTMGM